MLPEVVGEALRLLRWQNSSLFLTRPSARSSLYVNMSMWIWISAAPLKSSSAISDAVRHPLLALSLATSHTLPTTSLDLQLPPKRSGAPLQTWPCRPLCGLLRCARLFSLWHFIGLDAICRLYFCYGLFPSFVATIVFSFYTNFGLPQATLDSCLSARKRFAT